MIEVWKPIDGFDGYFVSSFGQVRSERRNKVTILKQQLLKTGYLFVGLSREGKGNSKKVHRLVAETFLGKKDGLHVNHIDGNKLNNKLSNLEWITGTENLCHRYLLNGRKRIGCRLNKKMNLFEAWITINKKEKLIGRFETEDESCAAYIVALKEHGIPNKYTEYSAIPPQHFKGEE